MVIASEPPSHQPMRNGRMTGAEPVQWYSERLEERLESGGESGREKPRCRAIGIAGNCRMSASAGERFGTAGRLGRPYGWGRREDLSGFGRSHSVTRASITRPHAPR